MTEKQKLELTWIGKEQEIKLEPRILIEDSEKSYGNKSTENMLIHGDNLLALKALEQDYAGKIKCIYIDPPFNTKQAFEHYHDGMEHSLWLTMIRDRVQLLYKLLSDEGSLFVHIDDNELAYLIVLIDEIFGRQNRISIITFKQSSTSGPKAINPGLVTTANYILYYVKNKNKWKPNKVFVKTERDSRYSKFIINREEDYSKWRLIGLREAFAKSRGIDVKKLKSTFGENLEEEISAFVLENAERVVRLARVAPKDVNVDARTALEMSTQTRDTVFISERENKEPYYFMNGEQVLFYATKVKLIDGTRATAQVASTIWDDILSNNIHNEGSVTFPNGKKPEFLIKRILDLSTIEDDFVLDSFLGSGTTAAVAHKMKRKWIGIELGDHCYSHCIPRLNKTVDGSDQSGISKSINWNGGGGYKFYELAPSLLKKDKFNNWIIDERYNPDMLAAAVAKQEGFRYMPYESVYWKQGKSSEKDYLFTTTTFITVEYLDKIHEEMQPDESLLICCKSFHEACIDRYENITIKKIPVMLLGRCEFDRDDYSLNIINSIEDAEILIDRSDSEVDA